MLVICRLCMFSLSFVLYASSEFIISLVIGLLLAQLAVIIIRILILGNCAYAVSHDVIVLCHTKD